MRHRYPIHDLVQCPAKIGAEDPYEFYEFMTLMKDDGLHMDARIECNWKFNDDFQPLCVPDMVFTSL